MRAWLHHSWLSHIEFLRKGEIRSDLSGSRTKDLAWAVKHSTSRTTQIRCSCRMGSWPPCSTTSRHWPPRSLAFMDKRSLWNTSAKMAATKWSIRMSSRLEEWPTSRKEQRPLRKRLASCTKIRVCPPRSPTYSSFRLNQVPKRK